MKAASTTTRAAAKQQAAAPNPTGIHITPGEGELMRQRAAASGQSIEQFVQAAIREGIAKLDPARLMAIPCPFCLQTDELEIIHWSQERRDGTEYDGDAVRCHRCEAVATVAAWAALHSKGGAA